MRHLWLEVEALRGEGWLARRRGWALPADAEESKRAPWRRKNGAARPENRRRKCAQICQSNGFSFESCTGAG